MAQSCIMKKYLFILALALICFSCSQENEFDGGNPSLKGFQVNADFIDLSVGSSNEQVGSIKVTSDEDEVKVKWISDPSFNIDTTQTSISMKNGQGVLPIKWQGKLENGAYAPSNILFKAGVVISSGDEEKYIPLYHVQNLDSAKVMENMQTRNTAAEPRISSIEFIPAAPVMGENGATLLVRLTNVEQAIVDYSNIKSSHNIDINETDLPTILSTAQSVLRFKWKDDSIRPAAFALPIMFYAFELVNPVSFTLVWNPEEPAITVNPAQHSVAYTGGTAVSQITSNSSWVVNKGAENWFTMTPTSGNGNGSITFTVSPNTGEARSATVTVVSGSVSKEIVINQAAQDISLSVDPASHSVANTGGTVTSTITSNAAWTATKGSESWFTMTPASGSGNGSIVFTVSPNNSISTRTATVTVTSGSITKQITITQAAQDISLTVDPASHSVTNAGGTVTSTVISNAAWTATKGTENWFTMTPASGNGNGTISFVVAPNTGATRSATVTITAGSITKQVVITQAVGTGEATPGDVTIEDWDGQTNIEVGGGEL